MHQLPDRIAAVLFDVGNTLHHLDHAFIADAVSRHSHLVSAHDVVVAESMAKAEVDARFRARFSGRNEDHRFSYFETILHTLQVTPATVDPIVRELQAEDTRESLWRVMQPDTPAVIAELRRRGYTLAVVSNADGRVATALHVRGIAHHFATIVDSHVVGVEKPDARIFHIALDACGTLPANAIYVGDIYEIDVRGARNAGLAPVLLDPIGAYAESDCLRIHTLSELLNILPGAA